MKILMVDDDPEIVQLLEIYIRNEGYEAVKAYNGKEALTKLRTDPGIDLVILDIMMPELDGMAVIKAVRKDSDVPILVLSAKPPIWIRFTAWLPGRMIMSRSHLIP